MLLIAAGFYFGGGEGSAGHRISVDPVDVSASVKITNHGAADETRTQLLDFIWPQGKLPGEMTIRDMKHPSLAAYPAQMWTVTMPHGVVSRSFFFDSGGSDCLFLWHDGHYRRPVTEAPAALELSARMLRDGCDVLLLSMPLYGVNADPVLSDHDELAQFESPTFSPIAYFMEPAAQALDEALARKPYSRVGMGGLSGGGWSTVLFAALDQRITHMYSVAGSMPFEVDIDPDVAGLITSSARGDYEQSYAPLYDIAGYLDLYLLGAQNRSAKHIYISADQCCFPPELMAAFAPELETYAADVVGGYLSFLRDSAATQHELSGWAIDVITNDFFDGPSS